MIEMRAGATSEGSGRSARHPLARAGTRRPAIDQLSDEAVDLISARLRVVAEPNRIRILGLLNQGDATVQELTDHLMTTHQNVSKHLGVLYQAGMVSRCKEGNAVRYALVDWTGWWLVEQMASSVADRIEGLQELFSDSGHIPLSRGETSTDPR